MTEKTNVTSIFAKRQEKNAEKEAESKPEKTQDEIDAEIKASMERNAKNKERIEKERLNANKSVLRSYRIKN